MKTMTTSGEVFPVMGCVGTKAIPLLDLPMLDDQWERLPCAGDNTRYWPACMLPESKAFLKSESGLMSRPSGTAPQADMASTGRSFSRMGRSLLSRRESM